MNLKLHQGLSMLEEELKVLNSDSETSAGTQSNFEQSAENENKITSNLSRLSAVEKSIKNSKSSDFSKDQLQDVSQQLEKLSDKIISKSSSVEKEIKDEIELLLTGINNINHFIQGLINENDSLTNYIDDKIENVNKSVKINIWLTASLIIMIIVELLIFFNN